MSVVRGESQLAGFPLMAEDESTYDKVAKFPCGSFEPSRGVAYHVLALAYEVPLYESQRGDGMRETMPQWCSERKHTAFLTSHGSSFPPAIHDSVAKHTALSLSRDSSSPLAAAAAVAVVEASRCLFATISALYSASSFWYLQVSFEVKLRVSFRYTMKSHTDRFTTPVLILSCLRVASSVLLILSGSQVEVGSLSYRASISALIFSHAARYGPKLKHRTTTGPIFLLIFLSYYQGYYITIIPLACPTRQLVSHPLYLL